MHYSVTECLQMDYWATGAFVKLPDWHSWPPFYSVCICAICVSKTCSWFTVYSEHYSASILLRCLGGTGLVTSHREMKDVPSYHTSSTCVLFSPMKIPIKPLNILSKKTRLKPARTHQQHQSQRSVWIFVERCDAVRETFRIKGSV